MKDKGIFNPNNANRLVLLHVLLGASVFLTSSGVIAWILGSLLFMLHVLLQAKRHEFWKLPVILAYICGIEILARIAKTSPFVPYEFAKYAYVIFLFIGTMKFSNQKLSAGFWIMILALPGLFLIPGENYRVLLVNSFLGIFLLGWAAHLLNNNYLDPKHLKLVLLSFVYGVIAITTAVIVHTPSLTELEFELGANFETAGGFGSNQVSTVLGAGFTLAALAFLLRVKLFNLKYSESFLPLVFLFRAILTFSRGGVLGGTLAVFLAYIIPGKTKGLRRIKLWYVILIFIGVSGTFYWVNEITGNMMLKRYQGETYATQIGAREVDAETLTSGRSELMIAEWKTFLEKPILGVGPGVGYDYRKKYAGVKKASHTEVTRLLAEHGIPGLIIASVFLFYPLLRIFRLRTKRERMLVTAFFILAIFSSFHAAMRTTVTPFFWALGCMRFPDDTKAA